MGQLDNPAQLWKLSLAAMPMISETESPISHDEDVTLQDMAAMEKVLQHIDFQNAKRGLVEQLANWKLALRMYREFELRFTCMADRSQVAAGHRAILLFLMAVTECMLTGSRVLTDDELKGIRLTHETLESNAAYLRSKYQQWYGLFDPRAIAATTQAIENAAH